jgi:hypothetical protein
MTILMPAALLAIVPVPAHLLRRATQNVPFELYRIRLADPRSLETMLVEVPIVK